MWSAVFAAEQSGERSSRKTKARNLNHDSEGNMSDADALLEGGRGGRLKGWKLNINSELEKITTQGIELGDIRRSKDQSNQYYELWDKEKQQKHS